MRIKDGIEIKELSIFLPKYKTIIVSDLHLGYEEYLLQYGIHIPKTFSKDIVENLINIVKKTRARKVILNGDVKHEFSGCLYTEYKWIRKLLKELKKLGLDVIVVRGNHDNFISGFLEKNAVKIVDKYIVDNILITHGHKNIEIPLNINTIIIGNEHPVISFRDEFGIIEKFKCFLLANINNKYVVVMPSFNTIMEGKDVKSGIISPILKKSTIKYAFVIAGGRIFKIKI